MATILILSHDRRLANQCKLGLAAEHEVLIESAYEAAVKLSAESAIGMAIVHSEIVSADMGNIAPLVNNGLRSLIIGSKWPEHNQINALMAGCFGYCEADISSGLLLKAVNSILKGDVWISRHLVPKVICSLVKLTPTSNETEKKDSVLEKNLALLTHREMDVVKMLGEGLSNKAIASMLNISERTVKAHLTSIFQKLDVQDRLQLALLLRKR